MSNFTRATRKLYYLDPYLYQAAAVVIKVGSDFVELDATVAYPEGGGQESDLGTLTLADATVIRFVHARKMYGHRVNVPDCPDVLAGGIVEHVVHPEDVPQLARLRMGEVLTVSIDTLRRARLSLSHTASHLLYLGVGATRADALAWTLGCHIRPDAARFDFGVSERFTAEDVQAIERIANAYVTRDAQVSTSSHPEHADVRYWKCEGQTIPCGGTHLSHTAPIGPLAVRRKSMGAGKERLSCQFERAAFDVTRFHANGPLDLRLRGQS
jgi:Ser-tRNA(Ala) deacylase AlaX